MHRSLIALACTVIALPLAAQQPSGGAATQPMRFPSQISASATGEARYVPDRATISLGVQTHAPTAAKASTDNAAKQQAIIDAIRALGIAADQISTTDYNLSADRVFNPAGGDKTPRIVGYIVNNTVHVEVRKVDQVGALIDAAISKGANEVSSLDFHSSAPDSLRRIALADAVHKAAADAAVLAQAAGGRIGELIELTTGGFEQPPRPMMRMAVEVAGQTPISIGTRGMTATVMARWRFVEGAK
jgi:uncharacterized protein